MPQAEHSTDFSPFFNAKSPKRFLPGNRVICAKFSKRHPSRFSNAAWHNQIPVPDHSQQQGGNCFLFVSGRD